MLWPQAWHRHEPTGSQSIGFSSFSVVPSPAQEGYSVVKAEAGRAPPPQCYCQLHCAILPEAEQAVHLHLLPPMAHEVIPSKTARVSLAMFQWWTKCKYSQSVLQALIIQLWFVALKKEYDHNKWSHLLIYKLPMAIPCLSASRWWCAVNWFTSLENPEIVHWKMLPKQVAGNSSGGVAGQPHSPCTVLRVQVRHFLHSLSPAQCVESVGTPLKAGFVLRDINAGDCSTCIGMLNTADLWAKWYNPHLSATLG